MVFRKIILFLSEHKNLQYYITWKKFSSQYQDLLYRLQLNQSGNTPSLNTVENR